MSPQGGPRQPQEAQLKRDPHYSAREAGGRASGVDKIRYALIITIEQ
jgi:hypothetical protein